MTTKRDIFTAAFKEERRINDILTNWERRKSGRRQERMTCRRRRQKERDERTGGFSFTLILLVDRKRAVLLEWLKGSSVYVASEIATVYLWASLREVELEFSPKGASNV